MANIFEFPLLSPLKAIWQTDKLVSDSGTVRYNSFNPSFNSVGFDDDIFKRQIRFFETPADYVVPFQQSDILRLPFYGSDATAAHYTARILDDKGGVYTPKTLTVNQQSGTWDGSKLYTIESTLWDLPEGYYYVQIKHNSGTEINYAIYQKFHVKQVHEGTIRIDCKNSYNDQSVVWFTDSWVMQYRVKGCITQVDPTSKFTTYEDQPLNNEFVSGIPYREYQLSFGTNVIGIPEQEADKIERMLNCDSNKIDGIELSRADGSKLEVKRNELGALHGYGIKLRERINAQTKAYSLNAQVLGDMPQTSYFWVERIMMQGGYITIRQPFRGKRNFLDYLNTNQLVGDGYWSEDANSKLVFYPDSDYTITGSFVMDAVDVLKYCFKFECQGAADFEVAVGGVTSSNYAVYYGDGISSTNKTSLAVYPSTTTITKTYTLDLTRDLMIFVSDAKSIEDVSTNIRVNKVGGDLPPSMIYYIPLASFPQVTEIENNMFNYVTAMVDFDVQYWALDTYEQTKLLQYIYLTLSRWDTSANIFMTNQDPNTSPNVSDEGVKPMIAAIEERVNQIVTD